MKLMVFTLGGIALTVLFLRPADEPGHPVRQTQAVGRQNAPYRVVEGFDGVLHAKTYTVSTGRCRVSWEVMTSEPNVGVIRHRSTCNSEWPAQMEAVAAIAAGVFGAEPGAAVPATLSWGRLSPDGAIDPPMSIRLALAAARSPSWNRSTGGPESGDINRFTRALCNEASIYPELRDSLGKLGLAVAVSSVEKVLVVKAGTLSYFEELRRHGVRAGDRLPYDCQAWFRITRR